MQLKYILAIKFVASVAEVVTAEDFAIKLLLFIAAYKFSRSTFLQFKARIFNLAHKSRRD